MTAARAAAALRARRWRPKDCWQAQQCARQATMSAAAQASPSRVTARCGCWCLRLRLRSQTCLHAPTKAARTKQKAFEKARRQASRTQARLDCFVPDCAGPIPSRSLAARAQEQLVGNMSVRASFPSILPYQSRQSASLSSGHGGSGELSRARYTVASLQHGVRMPDWKPKFDVANMVSGRARHSSEMPRLSLRTTTLRAMGDGCTSIGVIVTRGSSGDSDDNGDSGDGGVDELNVPLSAASDA
eukprot:570232-Pleurochrysis_carterae.AAC.1